jgi:hypothetical protein
MEEGKAFVPNDPTSLPTLVQNLDFFSASNGNSPNTGCREPVIVKKFAISRLGRLATAAPGYLLD